MPLQNRVTPEGDIVSHPARGLMMGNRGGAFHDACRRLGRRRWASRQWICCRLSFKDRHREVMAPGRYTELFFLDEVTALAAGHRPCFECRREDANLFAMLWAEAHGGDGRASAPQMDQRLHAERVDAQGGKLTHRARLAQLPDGAVIRRDGQSLLVWGESLCLWTPDGYQPPRYRPASGDAEVLTPPSIVAVLAAGFRPIVHPTATLGR
ncbi:MAG: hypothetical protein R3D44_13050 [Hyphomicrobiaceae bacterium]